MSDEPDLSEQLLDLMVYIPLGLALEAKELLPKLAERGRGQVNLARLAGRVAANRSEGDPRAVIDQLLTTVETLLGAPPRGAATAKGDAPKSADDLPIPDYDTLSAPQLLPHLDAMTDAQLGRLLAYEERHRSRATVINRIKQLQG